MAHLIGERGAFVNPRTARRNRQCDGWIEMQMKRMAVAIVALAVVAYGCRTQRSSNAGMTPLPFDWRGVRYSVVMEGAERVPAQPDARARCSFELSAKNGYVFAGARVEFVEPPAEPGKWNLFGPGKLGGGRPYWGRYRILPAHSSNSVPVFLELVLFDADQHPAWFRTFTNTCEGTIGHPCAR